MIDLAPSDGRATINEIAEHVQRAVEKLRAHRGVEQVDVVGHSMGALVSRTFIQRYGGRDVVRNFVSTAGPHGGSPLARIGGVPPWLAGIRDMRPGSAHLRDLERDADPWGKVRVHCIYTPWDMLIRPVETAILRGATSVHRIDVKIHRWVPSDPRVLARVAELIAP